MKHNDMKNRISLTLKDPILQAEFRNNGFTVSAMTEQQLKIALEKGEQLEKENAELEGKISVLLSCKNCPENKGGFICQKEYEDKCLAQKIKYVKELLEENAELKSGCGMCYRKDKEQLTKAKDLLKWFVWYFREGSPNLVPYKHKVAEAEHFLKEVSDK